MTCRGLRPVCAICGEPIYTDPDMHEAIITKAVAQGSYADINSVYNCVLVHPGGGASKCHGMAQTEEGRRLCIKHLVYYEGYTRVMEWVQTITLQLSPVTARERISFVQEFENADQERIV